METIQQIWNAVMQLTTAELLRLRLYARWQIQAIGRDAQGRDGMDLLEEAIVATATGEIPWKTAIDLCSHLIFAMHSITIEWIERSIPEYLESELIDVDTMNPLDSIATNTDPERTVVMKTAIEELSSKDPVTAQVVELLAHGSTPEDIQTRVSLSQRRYRAVIRQIRLTLQKECVDLFVANSSKSARRHLSQDRAGGSDLRREEHPKRR